jgi:hypothetical protein
LFFTGKGPSELRRGQIAGVHGSVGRASLRELGWLIDMPMLAPKWGSPGMPKHSDQDKLKDIFVIYLAETKDARYARVEYFISTVILVRLRRRMTVPPATGKLYTEVVNARKCQYGAFFHLRDEHEKSRKMRRLTYTDERIRVHGLIVARRFKILSGAHERRATMR